MAIEAIPFYVGRVLSTDDFTAVAGDTAVAAMSAAELNAKNRVWTLAAAEVAYLPVNRYRAAVVVDASAATTSATVTEGGATTRTIPAGTQLEVSRVLDLVHKGTLNITAGTGGCIVRETSYI